jgi:hypothetical protein
MYPLISRTTCKPLVSRGHHDYDTEDQQRPLAAIPGAITRVEDLIRRLEEKRADFAEPTIAPRVALKGRTLHPAIVTVAERLYLDGHYAQAVFEAGKALILLYAGAVMAIRNPGGHRVAVIEQPDRALQHLELLSYLAYRLDEAKKVR